MAFFQILGTFPVMIEMLKILANGLDKTFETFFRYRAGISSGVRDTVFFNLDIAWSTSVGVMIKLSISEKVFRKCWENIGGFVLSSVLNTLPNW